MITEKIYKNTDHINSITFEEDGEAQAINSATRMVIKFGKNDVRIDSNTANSWAFDWSTYGADGRLDLKLGRERDIVNLKDGRYRALVVIYDATYPNGLPWDELTFEVQNGG